MLKTAEVTMLFAKASCPSKYYLLFAGEVAAVQASVDAGHALGGTHVVDHCVIPRIHPQVIKAINMAAMPETMQAIGVMEFYSVTASIYGADAAVKAADVDLVDARLGTGIGGKSFVVLTGEVAAVREAVQCGIHTPNAEGMIISSVVIPSPHKELLESLLQEGDGKMLEDKQRIIQEFVPGKQVTLAHLIANPEKALYKKLGVIGEYNEALGIMTITPSEGTQ